MNISPLFAEHTNFLILNLIFAYTLGSLSGALIVTQLLNLGNPTESGSGNPGATNVLRLFGKKAGVFTLLIDVLKGLIVIAVAYYLELNDSQKLLAALACLVGHMYPIFYRFVGGKGVATWFGCMMLVDFYLTAICFALWLLISKTIKISSLSAIITFVSAPIIAYVFNWQMIDLAILIVMCLMILLRHKNNIIRLIHREEKRIENSY